MKLYSLCDAVAFLRRAIAITANMNSQKKSKKTFVHLHTVHCGTQQESRQQYCMWARDPNGPHQTTHSHIHILFCILYNNRLWILRHVSSLSSSTWDPQFLFPPAHSSLPYICAEPSSSLFSLFFFCFFGFRCKGPPADEITTVGSIN